MCLRPGSWWWVHHPLHARITGMMDQTLSCNRLELGSFPFATACQWPSWTSGCGLVGLAAVSEWCIRRSVPGRSLSLCLTGAALHWPQARSPPEDVCPSLWCGWCPEA